MSRRMQIYVLVGLLVVLAGILLGYWGSSPEVVSALSASEKFQPLSVDNPALRFDLLDRIRKVEYAGTHRNIFDFSLPPPPAPVQKPPETSPAPLQTLPLGEQPLQVPVKFYGYASDPQTGRRRAFFTNGEDVFIVAEGEQILRRFRLLRIGNVTADIEEISTGRRATLAMETGPSGTTP